MKAFSLPCSRRQDERITMMITSNFIINIIGIFIFKEKRKIFDGTRVKETKNVKETNINKEKLRGSGSTTLNC